MNLLQQFLNFLINQKDTPSLSTFKNYKADIGQFINWFEKEFNSPFDPSKVNLVILDQYKKARSLSPSSMERHFSSLRKFFKLLQTNKIISQDPLEKRTVSAEALAEADPWMLRNFKSYLYEYKKSNLTIKNYINDIKSFFVWLEEVTLIKYAWVVTERNLLDKVNYTTIEEYKQRLIAAKFSPRTINRKLSSLRNYIAWAKNQKLISENSEDSEIQTIRNSDYQIIRPSSPKLERGEQSDAPSLPSIPNRSSFPPLRLTQKLINGADFLFDAIFILPLVKTVESTQYLFWKASGKRVFKKSKFDSESLIPVSNIKKEFYAPLTVSTRYLPNHKRVWHYIRHVRPNWYKKYHSYSFTHYFHFAILIIVAAALGFGTYDSLFAQSQKEGATLAAASFAPPRILSFQGKLTDSSDNPITNATNILFSIYNDQNASGAAFLWQESNSIEPDSDGIFSVFLGKTTPIPDTLFSQNSQLFLGITIGSGPELSPRQELATVPFASNAETLQGLEPITNSTKVSNVVLALDSSGNLSIAGSKAHTFQTIGGQFVLSGSILSLTTVPGSNSRVEIVPDGVGKIDLSKPIQNSTNNSNVSFMKGAVEFDDNVAILATTSAQSAFHINQNSIGSLISASTSGIAKFGVESDGAGLFAGDLGINGGDMTSTATTFNLLNSTVTTLNVGGAATTLVLGASTGTITIRNATANIQGSVTLGDAATDTITFTGRVAQDSSLVPIGTSGTNNLGSASLPWDNAYIDNIYSASTGTFGPWQRASAALSPTNISDDILLGATATSSALIKFSGTSGNNSWINTGNVGIGTTTPLSKLDIQDSQSATAAAQIYNTSSGTDADGLVIKLGNTSTTAVASTNHFVSFQTAGIGIVGSIQGSGGKGVTYATSGVADFAEYFKKDKYLKIEFGSVVCLNNGFVVPCDNNNGKILGIASERPAFLGGENLGDSSIAVGLIGQVDTLVSISNGTIKAGDALASSDIPGVAVKATKAGQIVGKALENLDIIDEGKVVGFYDPDSKEYRSKDGFPNVPLKPNIIKIVKINTFANISWFDPGAYLANNGDLIIHKTGSNGYSVDSQNETLSNVGGFFKVVAANIKTGLLNAQEIIANSLIVTSDNIIVNGQNLRDYIVDVIQESPLRQDFGGQAGIISPIIRTDQVSANIISPLGKSLIVKLATPSAEIHDSQFIIQNSSGSAITTINNEGDASFSGQLSALDGQFENASISGTLRAFSFLTSHLSSNYIDVASFSAQIAYVPNLQAEQALFNQGLMVFGSTSLSDLSVVGNISIGGTMFITQNSIETLGTDLSLQSLRQGGLSIMGGLVYIDTHGNISTQGDLTVLGKLAVNIISPLPTSDLVVNNASGSGVLSINQKGDLISSGSGTFAKLNFSLVQPVLAVSATEAIASSSAGVANIAPYYAELTIKNALVTNESVIYITPVGTPSAQSPFLMRQLPAEFTVGVQSPNKNPIPFNWLIVN
ncbi:MAG: site-specific integrase [Candidatus Levybacteria bacterium]|nr:site-specific integrase [Candidatus Levybacteria bacterium]